MARPSPIEDKIAERLEGALERVKVDEAVDAGLKVATEASCVIGAKLLLDMVPVEDIFKWVQENPDLARTFMQSALIWQVSAPLSLVPVMGELLKDDDTKAALLGLAQQAGLVYGAVTLNLPMLALTLLAKPNEIKAVAASAAVRAETAQVRLTTLLAEIAGWEAKISELRQLIDQLENEARTNPGHSIERRLEQYYNDLETIQRALPGLYQLKAELEAEIRAGQDAAERAQEAIRRAASMFRWSVAAVVGTYAAASLIYAGDTIFDVLKEAFGAFKIPFKGGV